VLEGRVKLGAVTLNEMRDALGLDPYTNVAADRPMVLTATGYVPIEANVGGAGASAQNAAKQNPHASSEIEHSIGHAFRERTAENALHKASPDDLKHPGWPAGTPDGKGGQFRPKDGNDAKSSAPTPKAGSSNTSGNQIRFQKYGRGHHWVTVNIFTKRNFSDAVKAFFDNARSGPLADPTVNHNTTEHRLYDSAVNQLLEEFLKKNNITEAQMTVEQAKEFVQKVKNSNVPAIRQFVIKINREVLRYNRFFSPWRRGGGGDED
jgi:hypothetical protein